MDAVSRSSNAIANFAGNVFAYALTGLGYGISCVAYPTAQQINNFASTIVNGVGETLLNSVNYTACEPRTNYVMQTINGTLIGIETILAGYYLLDIYENFCLYYKNKDDLRPKPCADDATCDPKFVQVKTPDDKKGEPKNFNVTTAPLKPNKDEWPVPHPFAFLTDQTLIFNTTKFERNLRALLAATGSASLGAIQFLGTSSIYYNPKESAGWGDAFKRMVAATPNIVIGIGVGLPATYINTNILNACLVAPALLGGGLYSISTMKGKWRQTSDKLKPEERGINYPRIGWDLSKLALGVYLAATGVFMWYDMTQRYNPGS